MKCNHLIVLLVLTVMAGLTLAVDQPDQQQQQQHQMLTRRLIRLPEMINFDRFQQIYNKHYPTLLVKMARARLFAANAFKAFISGVNYMWRRSTKYLVVNKWSDSTVEERRKLMNYGGSSPHTHASTKENLVADVADVERKMNEIVEHKNDNEVYAEIAGELETCGSRRKRSLPEEQPKRQLSIDQIREPENAARSSSENLPEDEAKEILQEPTNGWFSKIVSSVCDYVKSRTTISNNEDEPITTEKSPKREPIIHSHPNPNNTKDQVFLDYNDSGCMAPIVDQLNCGCCYVMSTMAVLEYNYCMQTKELVPFSKQYVIDCGFELKKRDPNPWRVRIEGCNGGFERHVGVFAINYGIVPESKYPYNGTQGECPNLEEYRNEAEIRIEAGDDADWHVLEPASSVSDDVIREYLEKYGPMTIATNLYDDFQFYGGGVDLMTECWPEGGHAMVLVGHGIEDGIEYWLIRNSHGANWGVKGHWKLAKSSKECLSAIGFGYPFKFYHNS